MSSRQAERSVGHLLHAWRQRRRLSQLELALAAEVSALHISFVETGRSRPSREMLLHLAHHLDIPLRERNDLLLAAGLAPQYNETPLDDEAMRSVRRALHRILAAQEPFPAVVVDRRWDIVLSNEPARRVLTLSVAPELLAPPVNALRVSLHPDGLAPRIVNFAEYSSHLLTRLDRQGEIGEPVARGLAGRLADISERVENDSRSAGRCVHVVRSPAYARSRRRRARVLLDPHGLWDAARYHSRRSRGGVLLPCRRRHRERAVVWLSSVGDPPAVIMKAAAGLTPDVIDPGGTRCQRWCRAAMPAAQCTEREGATMTQEAVTTAEPAVRTRFTVAHWSAFWAKPDADLAARAAVPDVVGDWPGDPAPVRGTDAYRDRIAQVLRRVPDLHLEVAESAENGDVIFIHWVAYGTGAKGPFQMDGIDRILLQDGLVKENVIRYDTATFEALVGSDAESSE